MKTHILFINTNKEELIFFVEALKEVPHDDGFKCTYATSSSQAFEMLKYLTPHYIFTSHQPPEIDCMQLLAAVKKEARSDYPKTYLYANSIDDQVNKMAKVLGADGCIERPGQQEQLVHKLKAILAAEPAYFRENV